MIRCTWRVMRNTHRIANQHTRFKVSYGWWTRANLSGNWTWHMVHETYHATREAAIADADTSKLVYGCMNMGKDPGRFLNALPCGNCGTVLHITNDSLGRCGVGAVFFCDPCGKLLADALKQEPKS